MKWKEPGVQMLRRQGTFNPFTKQEFKASAIWTAMLLTLCIISIYSDDQPMIELAQRAPIVILAGIALSLLISFAHWASPLSVSSGPNGIVRSKGETHTLIPWATVRQHRFLEGDAELVLELFVSYRLEPETLYLPLNANLKEISDEIERMTVRVN